MMLSTTAIDSSFLMLPRSLDASKLGYAVVQAEGPHKWNRQNFISFTYSTYPINIFSTIEFTMEGVTDKPKFPKD